MSAPGPLSHVTLADGSSAPFYAVQYDKSGASSSPLTQDHLVDALRKGSFSDVFVFSHGWNNDWDTALTRYENFIAELKAIRTAHPFDLGREFTPLLCGVFWPSTALVAPWEQGPDLAADEIDRPAERSLRDDIASVAELVREEDRPRYYELVEREDLERAEAEELAAMLDPAYSQGDPDVDDVTGEPRGGGDGAGLLRAWEALEQEAPGTSGRMIPEDPTDFGTPADAGPPGGGPDLGGPEAAGILDKLNPRNLVRGMTVRQMKDRAGLIGTRGVGALLRRCLDATEGDAPPPRFHLIGHSYGARVMLNAVSRPEGGALPRPVDSMLLLQPAVNHLCFAASLPGMAGPAGNRAALAMVRQPILTTFSENDQPLHDFFHLALWRSGDIGEVDVAGDVDEVETPPSKYAALGGYGPRGEGVDWRPITTKLPTHDPVVDEDFYDLGADAPAVWALNGITSIQGHGDVVSPTTAWALLSLVRSS